MAQAVSRLPVRSDIRVRSQVSTREICGGQSGTDTGFCPSISVFLCQFRSMLVDPFIVDAVQCSKLTASFSYTHLRFAAIF
jgi:hypothetical protein